jgi:hypothetical protein
MSNVSEVFLFITIPTHLRVMTDTADLLQSSGRYLPVLVYYPSAVFDQNHANCQQMPHEAFIWTGNRFLSKVEYLTGTLRTDSTARWLPNEGFSRWLPNKGLNRRLARVFPFLPTPTNLVSEVHRLISFAASVVRFVGGAYGIARSALFSLIAAFKSPSVQQKSQSAFVNRNWLQRFLLHTFATEWGSSNRQELHAEIGFRQRLIRLFSDSLFSGLSDQKRFFEEISKLIQDKKPVLIVLPEANLFYDSQFVIRAAHLNSTPVAIVPFTIVNTLEWAEAFYDVPLYQANRGWNRVFARAFPHWILEHKARGLILPPVQVLGCEYFDMVPPIPWLINSGDADVIAAESHFMSDYYLRAGIQKEKIHLTGALSDDRLFTLLKERELHRKALGERFCFQIREKVVLIGLPPDQFGGGRRHGCEHDSYEDLIRFMVGVVASLSGSQVTVLINLHPRIKYSDVAWLSALGATIVDEPIERLVPLADVYVAVASATIRLGISCGIPVINYDAYQYDYDDYKGLAGVCEVKSKHEYESVLGALITDQLFYSRVHAAQKETASNLCLVDGKAGERMINLFNRLTSFGEVA